MKSKRCLVGGVAFLLWMLGTNQASAEGNLLGLYNFTPSVQHSGEVVFGPDSIDPVHAYTSQAGDQMHFRLSRGDCDPSNPVYPACDQTNPYARDFFIVPYRYGMAIEYPSTIEVWSHDFSVHQNHQGCLNGTSDCNSAARFWVGDETDSGGLYVTAHDKASGVGSNLESSVTIAASRFDGQGHGSLYFRVGEATDRFAFTFGSVGNEAEAASIDAAGVAHFSQGVQTSGASLASRIAADMPTYGIGDVLVIDDQADVQVKIAKDAYSTKVAGVYAVKPAVLANAPSNVIAGPNDVPLAINGIVLCKVSAENGPIHRGDLLVTSATPGHAMRAWKTKDNCNKGKDKDNKDKDDLPEGVVIGKAMQELPKGTGVIMILLNVR